MTRMKKPSKVPLAKITPEQEARLREIEEDALLHFEGQIDDLERAIGMLRLGHHFGWKPLVLVHSKKTVSKYEDILGIRLRDEFQEEGPSHQRSIGYKIVQKFIVEKVSNFWKAVNGEIPVEHKKELSK